MTNGHACPGARSELMQGTLGLRVLQALDTIGSQHGQGGARRTEQTRGEFLKLNGGTVCAASMRLPQQRWSSSSWRTSEPNRKARFHAITATADPQLVREVAAWDQLAGAVARLRGAEQG